MAIIVRPSWFRTMMCGVGIGAVVSAAIVLAVVLARVVGGAP
jgi:hypothetical protein